MPISSVIMFVGIFSRDMDGTSSSDDDAMTLYQDKNGDGGFGEAELWHEKIKRGQKNEGREIICLLRDVSWRSASMTGW
jgi:hypothetical protein